MFSLFVFTLLLAENKLWAKPQAAVVLTSVSRRSINTLKLSLHSKSLLFQVSSKEKAHYSMKMKIWSLFAWQDLPQGIWSRKAVTMKAEWAWEEPALSQKQVNECPSSAWFNGPSLHNPPLFKELKDLFQALVFLHRFAVSPTSSSKTDPHPRSSLHWHVLPLCAQTT